MTKILTAVAIILTIMSFYVHSISPNSSDASTLVGLLLFCMAFIVGVVAFCLSIYDIGAAGKGYRARRVMFTVSIPFLGAGALMVGGLLFTVDWGNSDASAETVLDGQVQTNTVVQDPEIVSLLSSVGAKGDYSDLELTWSNGDMEKDCGWADASGCYRGQGESHRLVLKRADNQAWLRVAVAHEFLHYIWYKNNLKDDQMLNSHLIDFYGKNPPFQNRINTHYVDSGSLNASEFFSYGCTEVSDVRLGGYIANRCNEFIDTSTLSAMY